MPIEYRNLSDEELIARVQDNKDKDAQHVLFKRYKHIVLGVLLYHLKDESAATLGTAEVFEYLWIDAQKNPIISFREWIHNTTKRYAIRYLKEQEKPIPIALEISNNKWETYLNLQTLNEFNKEAFKQCTRSMNPKSYEWIEMFYKEEKSIKDIASIKQVSEITVLKEIQAAKRQLKVCIHQKISR